jgi:hypothetical protein
MTIRCVVGRPELDCVQGLFRLCNPQLPRTMAINSLHPAHTHQVFVHLRAVAEARNKAVQNFRTTQEYVTWLSIHGPQEAGLGRCE